MSDIRRTRTVDVTSHLSPIDRQNLVILRTGALWPSLLNVMERYCIEQESALIRTNVRDDQAIIANHMKAQVSWQMFEHLQEHVLREVQLQDENLLRMPDPMEDDEDA